MIAYFSMEIGVDPDIPSCAGGLGVLAGDIVRAWQRSVRGVGGDAAYRLAQEAVLKAYGLGQAPGRGLSSPISEPVGAMTAATETGHDRH
jgi:hypothetical protein